MAFHHTLHACPPNLEPRGNHPCHSPIPPCPHQALGVAAIPTLCALSREVCQFRILSTSGTLQQTHILLCLLSSGPLCHGSQARLLVSELEAPVLYRQDMCSASLLCWAAVNTHVQVFTWIPMLSVNLGHRHAVCSFKSPQPRHGFLSRLCLLPATCLWGKQVSGVFPGVL